MNRFLYLFPIALFFVSRLVFVRDKAVKKLSQLFLDELVKPRMPGLIDNDFIGDPNGLFQLGHHVLSPRVEIRGIVGSHLRPGDFWDRSDVTAANCKKRVDESLSVMTPSKTFRCIERQICWTSNSN